MPCVVCRLSMHYNCFMKDEPTGNIYVHFRCYHVWMAPQGMKEGAWYYVLLHGKRNHCTGVCCQQPHVRLHKYAMDGGIML